MRRQPQVLRSAPRASKAGKVSRGASNVLTSLAKKQRSFKAGQTIEVWVSAPNFNTKVARFKLRKGKIPTTEPFCAPPARSLLRRPVTENRRRAESLFGSAR